VPSHALAVARPEVLIAEENVSVPVTAPDQVAVTAALRSGAVASVFYRGGRSRAGGLRREINGTSGDLLLTSASADGNIQSTELTLAGGSRTATEMSPLTVPTYLDADLAAVPAGPPRNVAAVYAARRLPTTWPRAPMTFPTSPTPCASTGSSPTSKPPPAAERPRRRALLDILTIARPAKGARSPARPASARFTRRGVRCGRLGAWPAGAAARAGADYR
jgi:hypothetical protein